MSLGERIDVARADPDSVWWISNVLLRQGMSEDEVRSVLLAEDPEIVRRHLELHRERLTELVHDELGTVDVIERFLTNPACSVSPGKRTCQI
jgi:hypothetical protein